MKSYLSLPCVLYAFKSSLFWVRLSYCYLLFSTTWGVKALLQVFTCSSVQFSRSVVSDSLRPTEPQHARPPCPSPTPGVHPNPCPLGRWCHPTISSSVVPFSSCPQSSPASGSFQMSQLFASGGRSTGVAASKSVLLITCSMLSVMGILQCTYSLNIYWALVWTPKCVKNWKECRNK